MNTRLKQVAKNSAILYVRMVFVVLLSFYTSRLVLNALGIQDFGIYSVVVGAVSIFSILGTSLSLSTQRFIAFELGRGNKQKIDQIINISLVIHIILAFLILLLFQFLSNQEIVSLLNIPYERMEAARRVMLFAGWGLVFTTIQIPFQAVVLAYEATTLFAVNGIVEAVLKLLSALMLSYTECCDRLIFFSITQVIIALIVLSLFILFSSRCNPIKIQLIKNKQLAKRVIVFASWCAFGELAWVATLQGVNMLLNLFFNPILNAAYAIALSVSSVMSRFVLSIQVALNPPIIKEYASNNNSAVQSLLFMGVKYSYFLLLLVSLPLSLHIDLILNVWLGDVPKYTNIFCIFVLVSLLIDMLSNIFSVVVKATGKVKTYQLVISLILFLNFPGSYLVLSLGFPAYSIYLVYISVSLSLLIARILFLESIFQQKLFHVYTRCVFVPIIKVTVSAVVVTLFVGYCSAEDLLSFISSTTCSITTSAIFIYVLGLTSTERELVKKQFIIFIGKINGRKQS